MTSQPGLPEFTSRLTRLQTSVERVDPDGVDAVLRLTLATHLFLTHDRLRARAEPFDRAAFLQVLDEAGRLVDRLDPLRRAPEGAPAAPRPPYETFVADLYSRCWARYSDAEFDATIDMFGERLRLNGVTSDVLAGVDALDAGCGSGRYTMAMAKLGARHAHGVDLSARATTDAAARAARLGYGGRVTFEQQSVIALPEPWTGRFDFVCSNGVVHHTPDPILGLREIARVLKPGGHAFVMVYGTGGLFWALVDFCRAMVGPVPLDSADAWFDLERTPVGKVFFCLDHWYTQFQERITRETFESRLRDVGFTAVRYLPRALAYDASERLARFPDEADLIGEPDMRYLATRA